MSAESSEIRRQLDVLQESVCACDTCVTMCRTNPCVPNPEEAVKIMEKYGREALSLRVEHGGYDDCTDEYLETDVLVMARRDGRAGKHEDGRYRSAFSDLMMDETKRGCVMLTKDGKCELHDSGFKPEGARRVRHLTPEEKSDIRTIMFRQLDSVHDLLIELWGEDGEEAVELWKQGLSES